MPSLKCVSTLGVLSNTEVSKGLALACARIEQVKDNIAAYKQMCEDVEQILLELPIILLESIILSTTNLLTKQVDNCRTSRGLPTALQVLPQPSVTQLDFGQLFTGARLSRPLNTQCRAALLTSLARTHNLTKLVLHSKCTNDILESLGKNCPLMLELQISLSELVTDAGLVWLVPCESQDFQGGEEGGPSASPSTDLWTPYSGCAKLVTLDLLKCWNVSPSGVQILLLGLKKLRKLFFSNMKSVIERLVKNDDIIRAPFLLEYFDSSEYDLITDLHLESVSLPDTNPACWMSGPVHLSHIPQLFPHITVVKMMLTDAEVRSLTIITKLVHLEVEFSDDPGPGLQHLLDNHPNISKFIHLFMQVGPIQGSHLVSIARNCQKLVFLRIIGFQVENTSSLRPNFNYFKCLSQLHLSLYDDSYGDSSDEDEAPLEVSRHTPDIVHFFLHSSVNLQIVNIHMNFDAFLTDQFLHQLLQQNPLQQLTRLSLSGPKDLNLGLSTVHWIVATLPSIKTLCVSKWKLTQKEVKTLRNDARKNNLDLVFD